MSRYAGGWDFTGRSDEYLREAYDLFAQGSDDATGVYASGMAAIVEESHARALAANEPSAGELGPVSISTRRVNEFRTEVIADGRIVGVVIHLGHVADSHLAEANSRYLGRFSTEASALAAISRKLQNPAVRNPFRVTS